MKEITWKDIVIADAKAHGICNEYAELLRRCKSLSDFLALYRRGPDWALENQVPTISLLRQYPEGLDLHGILVDKHFDGDVLMDRTVYIFQHCTGTIRTGLNVPRKIIPMLYFANGCDMRIESANGDDMPSPIQVPLYIFGENRIESEESAKIRCKYIKREVK